jgi:hypothetical protein
MKWRGLAGPKRSRRQNERWTCRRTRQHAHAPHGPPQTSSRRRRGDATGCGGEAGGGAGAARRRTS